MSNWCTTNITMEARDESPAALAAIKNLKKNIEYFFNSPADDISLAYNGFGNTWLGNFVLQNNIGCEVSSLQNSAEDTTEKYIYNDAFECKDGKRIYSIYRCRGSIEYMDDFYDDDEEITSFSFTQADAWSPCLLMWKEIIARNYSDANGPLILLWYQAEEPGCELYYTNDVDGRFYPDTWVMNANIEPIYPSLDLVSGNEINLYEWFDNDDEVLSFINNNITSHKFETVEQAVEFIQYAVSAVPLFRNYKADDDGLFADAYPIGTYGINDYFECHEYKFADVEDVDYINEDVYKIIKKLKLEENK